MELRFKMDIHSVLIRVTNAAVWKCQCESLKAYRRRRFERTINFAQEEAEWITQAEKEAATKVEIELNKVLRNSMHRKLEEHIAAIKEDASRSLKSSAELRKSATQRLIIEQRSCGRREAMASFRAIHAEQVQLRASCLICDAYLVCFTQEQLEKFNCPSEHKCLHNSGASEEASDASAEVKNWGNIAQGELSTLEKQEEEYLLRLLAKEPSVSSLWQAIVEKK
ncbi:hypothetical protein P3T76_010278 [Phytophthora citrophthora]|uniref:Uncharacterized protein n=1 Tax=Phytophthora citrophthora TaxID=4793 RepID=A0AAD9GBP1_9STRA|nr:hypothetical protein P3T76_010278 [Phytophthora citrophthora]